MPGEISDQSADDAQNHETLASIDATQPTDDLQNDGSASIDLTQSGLDAVETVVDADDDEIALEGRSDGFAFRSADELPVDATDATDATDQVDPFVALDASVGDAEAKFKSRVLGALAATFGESYPEVATAAAHPDAAKHLRFVSEILTDQNMFWPAYTMALGKFRFEMVFSAEGSEYVARPHSYHGLAAAPDKRVKDSMAADPRNWPFGPASDSAANDAAIVDTSAIVDATVPKDTQTVGTLDDLRLRLEVEHPDAIDKVREAVRALTDGDLPYGTTVEGFKSTLTLRPNEPTWTVIEDPILGWCASGLAWVDIEFDRNEEFWVERVKSLAQSVRAIRVAIPFELVEYYASSEGRIYARTKLSQHGSLTDGWLGISDKDELLNGLSVGGVAIDGAVHD